MRCVVVVTLFFAIDVLLSTLKSGHYLGVYLRLWSETTLAALCGGTYVRSVLRFLPRGLAFKDAQATLAPWFEISFQDGIVLTEIHL